MKGWIKLNVLCDVIDQGTRELRKLGIENKEVYFKPYLFQISRIDSIVLEPDHLEKGEGLIIVDCDAYEVKESAEEIQELIKLNANGINR